jgi:hypothetical protein
MTVSLRVGVGSAETLCCSPFAAICSDGAENRARVRSAGGDRDLSFAAAHKRAYRWEPNEMLDDQK